MAPYGFLGLGIMGEAMARNLLKLGAGVVIYNRSADKARALSPSRRNGGALCGRERGLTRLRCCAPQCAALVKEGAVAAASPAAVLAQCDITFAMLSDPAAAEAVVFGPGGVLEGVTAGKGYVDMSTGAPW